MGIFRVFLFMAFISSCVTPSDPSQLLSDEEQKKLEEYKAEVELGRNMAGRLLQFYGTYSDEELVRYVNQVGLYVASFSDFPERRYMFSILDTPVVNAFACPGGYILITLGTLRNVKSEAELAMILGHEITHVGKRHIFKTLMTMNEKDKETAARKAEKSDNDDPQAQARRRPNSDFSSETGAVFARYLSGATGAGISLLKAAKAGMNLMLEDGLDKKLEFEADIEGVQNAIRAGYQPVAMQDFLTRVETGKSKLNTKILEKTHPKLSDRKAHIAEMLVRIRANEMVGAEGVDRFQKYAEKLNKKS